MRARAGLGRRRIGDRGRRRGVGWDCVLVPLVATVGWKKLFFSILSGRIGVLIQLGRTCRLFIDVRRRPCNIYIVRASVDRLHYVCHHDNA